MSLDINLLPNATRFQLFQQQFLKKLKKIVWVVVLIWIGIMIVLTGLKFWMGNRLKSLAAQKKNVEKELLRFNPQLELQLGLRYRLKLVADIMKSRDLYSQRLETLFSLFPEGTDIKDIEFNGNKTKIGGKISSLIGVKQFEDNVEKIKRDRVYEGIELKTLSYQEGVWNFSLEITHKQNESK